jgi:hypothetical protein
MPIQFLIDEDMPRAVYHAIVRHNQKTRDTIDAMYVGQLNAPPKGTQDPDLLIWAEETRRLLVSYDKRTLPKNFATHLVAGRHVPGIFLFKLHHSFPFIAEFLATVTHASSPDEWIDRIFVVE